MIKNTIKKILEFNKISYLKRTILTKKRKALSIDNVRSILCIQMNAIGDCIMTQPVLAEIKSKIPNAKIDLICRPHIAPIFKNDDSIDSIFQFDTKKYRNWLFKKQYELNSKICMISYLNIMGMMNRT